VSILKLVIIEENKMDVIESLPKIINPSTPFEKPNQKIKIYQGEFKIKTTNEEIIFNGSLEYRWFPNVGVYIDGTTKPDSKLIQKLKNDNLDVVIDNHTFGRDLGIIEFSNRRIQGFIFSPSVLGDRSISVNKVLFAIPNLIDLTPNSRIELSDENFKIIIEKRLNFENYQKQLKNFGGYLLLYFGELTSNRNKPIDFSTSENILGELSLFITFINSRRVSILFRKGQFEKDILWQDFTHYENATYQNVFGWVVPTETDKLNILWGNFRSIYSSQDGKDFLQNVIQWYIDSMNSFSNVIGGIITAQTALELLFNWLVIEKKKMIIGKDAENINASNKLRLLLAVINVNSETPHKFADLKKYIDDNSNINDALEAIVSIRNAAVHAQKEKRKKLAEINIETKLQALKLSQKYIELAILYILGYNGNFFDRTFNSVYKIECIQPVPWK